MAHGNGELLGTASLGVHDLEGRRDLTPWLGGVCVAPAYRRRGIGTALCGAVEQRAVEFGFRELFLFTFDLEGWYRSLGWNPIERGKYRGHPIVVMKKLLAQQRLGANDGRPD